MKIVVIGLGSIGLRHARILKERLGHDVVALRHSSGAPANSLGIPEFFSWNDLAGAGAKAAFICTPTHQHLDAAMQAASLGMHLFIEKPLADTLEGIAALEAACLQRQLTTYVAYGLRFHPVIMHLKDFLKDKSVLHARVVCSSYLHKWRPAQTAPNYSSHKAQGGGVILDLSHEFDYVRYILGEVARMEGRRGRRSNVTVDAEDYADALVTLANGTPVNVHIDFLSEHVQRAIQVDFQGGFIAGDLIANTVTVEANGQTNSIDLPVERDAYLETQACYFFDHIGRNIPMNSIGDAKVLLAKILEFRNA